MSTEHLYVDPMAQWETDIAKRHVTMQSTNLSIAVPTTGWTPMEWTLGLIALDKPPYFFLVDNTVPLDLARNNLVRKFLVENPYAEFLLFYDTDIVPPPDALRKLMGYKADIISGLYHQKRPPFYPLLMRKHTSLQRGYMTVIRWVEGKVVEVDATGLGFMLVHKRVFQKVDPPWFWFDTERNISEDFNFCAKAKENGFKVYVDTSIILGHLAHLTINLDTYRMYQQRELDKGFLPGEDRLMKTS